jgi:hypothetical protein
MGFSIHTADNSLLRLMFLRTASILFGCPIINLHSCHQDKKSLIGPIAYHPHTIFNFRKLLTYLSHDYGSFINNSGNDLDVSGIGKCLIFMHIRHMVRLFEI